MKKFIVDTGDKKYAVETNTYDEAISAVKAIQSKDGTRWKNVTELREGDNFQLKGESRVYKVKKIYIRSDVIDVYTYTGEHFEFTWQNYVNIWDSIKDEASPLQTVNALLEDERAAVDAYNVALENLKGKIPDESYAAIEAIRDDENRHIENLQAVVNGTVTEKNLTDSSKSEFITGDIVQGNDRFAGNGPENKYKVMEKIGRGKYRVQPLTESAKRYANGKSVIIIKVPEEDYILKDSVKDGKLDVGSPEEVYRKITSDAVWHYHGAYGTDRDDVAEYFKKKGHTVQLQKDPDPSNPYYAYRKWLLKK